ncbi:MAG: TfoX/Sxy family protein [Treponema sp.]|jgi:DNA transformation protein|nr:TfoX/Sxy family protein [Treponema sp.]
MGELSKIINIGKELEKQLNEVGIETFDELEKIGSCNVWSKMREIDSSVCYNRLYGLEDVIQAIR